jgi:outer membrane protein assembly factor BamB
MADKGLLQRIYFFNYFPGRLSGIFLLMMIALLSLNFDAYSANWDQFRGADRNGHVKVCESEMSWIEPEFLWSVEIGSGFSEVVVVDEVIYLMMAEMIDNITGWELLVAMDSNTGKTIWKTRIDKVYIDEDDWGNGSRSTPVVDQNSVYCFSGSGKLAAVCRSTGKMQWEVDFTTKYGSTIPRWGYSASPLLFQDMVIMEVGGTNNHGFGAFSKKDGSLLWHAGDVAAAYNSPVLAEVNGNHHLIFASGAFLHALGPDGDSLWSFNMPLRSPVASPLFIEPDLVFVSAANDAGSFMIKITGNGAEEVMRSSSMKNDWSSSCYKDGFIYGFNVATLQCIDAQTGQRKWLKRGLGKGSLIIINDRLFVLSDLGKLAVIETNPNEYREIYTIEVLEGRSWTAPSFSNGRLYFRNLTHLTSYKVMDINNHDG